MGSSEQGPPDLGQLKHECQDAIQTLYHYLDGELTPDRRATIKQHLDDCPPCIQAFEFEADLRRVVSRGCQEAVPDELRSRIAMLLDHEHRQSQRPG